MKRLLLVFMLFCGYISSDAQIAKWLIPPLYDKISLVSGIDAIMTDSTDIKTVWTYSGKRLITSKDDLFPFKEGLSLALKRGTASITTIYKENGESVNVSGCSVAHAFPYYSNGKLLVLQGDDYKYIDSNGVILSGSYASAYPYYNGYAACDIYLNMEKKKDIVHLLIDNNGKPCKFSFQGKEIDTDDIQFVSSVNDEDIAITVIKQRVYFYNAKEKMLTPVMIKDVQSPNLKEQAKITSDISQCFLQNVDSTYTLTAKCGKSDVVSIVFDIMKRPQYIKRNDVEHYYKNIKEETKLRNSELKISKEGGLIGLYWNNGKEILPPQFEEVISCFDNKALVKIKGKVGMLEILKDETFKLKMNKGDDIAFRHQKFETNIRADFPTFLNANKVNIEINNQTGCDIDKTSKESKNTESGNYVQYNCVLNIPADLPDELTTIEYPVTILYEGIKSSTIPFKVNAWHYKYFVVDIDDSQTALENGAVSFVFNINAERIASDGVYPTTVNILTDSLTYEYEKMSEVRHKCKVHSLREGVNNIVVQILEQGCPPASFPFEVEYHKPVARSKNKPAEKEKVTIKKKERTPKRVIENESRPRVIM